MPNAGPNGPSTATVLAAGSATWASPSNITAADGAYATCSTASSSKYLAGEGFGFSIPTAATINGILLEILRKASSASVSDATVSLLKAGATAGTTKAGGAWPTTAAYQSYGGSTDLWGTTWTPADVNASGFGAAVTIQISGLSTLTAYVDYMRITVSYTGGGLTTGPSVYTTSQAVTRASVW